jgi:hypothetical protein
MCEIDIRTEDRPLACPADQHVFSANSGLSLKAWGIAPGVWSVSSKSAEGATQARLKHTAMNRTFSAEA